MCWKLWALFASYTLLKMTSFPPVFLATVLRRPSAKIKSPYVADVRLSCGRELLCHTPGLGCSGLVEAGREIYVTLAPEGSKSKTACAAIIAACSDSTGSYTVGLQPLMSQKLAHGLLDRLVSSPCIWASEVSVTIPGFEATRLDYVGTQVDGKKVYVEVKNAMIAWDAATSRTKRRAVFPDGFRKKKTEPVSPRAIKHAEALAALRKHDDTAACILLFMVPRTDCHDGLLINPTDPLYCAAVGAAVRAGVSVRAFSSIYDETKCTATLAEEVPVFLDWR